MRSLAAAAVFTTATAALLIAGPPEAGASPLTYLQSLNNRGLVVTDTAQAIGLGYAICAALDTARGDVVAAQVYAQTDVATLGQAQIMVVTAVEELCSQHDHRGVVIA